MSGETNLQKLLATMSPTLVPGEFVFCSFTDAAYDDHQHLAPVAAIQEEEGLTLVISREMADRHGIGYEASFRRITLKVHSSLEAVGLTAAFSRVLTETGISANVVAGYYHDHIYVQSDRALAAVEVLEGLATSAAADAKDE